MNDTIQIAIAVKDAQLKDQLIAQLSVAGFNAFEENEEELLAFINLNEYEASVIENILFPYHLGFIKTVIKDQNWNALWESNFPPVVVNNFCAVRASFHPPFTNVQHEIIITPKMSFGTGHHATTYMMIDEMSKLNFKSKKVADFGTGTGILAILAEKLGSASIWAIDNDDWSIANATENVEKNNCKKIEVEKKESFETFEHFDIILANINKNVILESVDKLTRAARTSTHLLLSGLLKDDEADILAAFTPKGFKHLSTVEKNKWICLLLQYN